MSKSETSMRAGWISTREILFSRISPPSTPNFARLSLVKTPGLLGGFRFNVFEQRWQKTRSSQNESGGRLLRFRFVNENEAQQILEERCDTLIRLGYRLADGQKDSNDGWEWLEKLIQRPPRAKNEHDSILRFAQDLGYSRGELTQGLASILGVRVSDLEKPSSRTLRTVHRDTFEKLLPHLLIISDPHLRAIGQHWLDFPPTLFEIQASTLSEWLENNEALVRRLEPQLKKQALALIGPKNILRLSVQSKSKLLGEILSPWYERLQAN